MRRRNRYQNHLAMALFLKQAGLEMIHVGYKGNAPSMADLAPGTCPPCCPIPSDAVPQAAAGQISCLRSRASGAPPQFAGPPSISESLFRNSRRWRGTDLLAPAGTPKQVVELARQAASDATRDPTFGRPAWPSSGSDPIGKHPQEFAATIAADNRDVTRP